MAVITTYDQVKAVFPDLTPNSTVGTYVSLLKTLILQINQQLADAQAAVASAVALGLPASSLTAFNQAVASFQQQLAIMTAQFNGLNGFDVNLMVSSLIGPAVPPAGTNPPPPPPSHPDAAPVGPLPFSGDGVRIFGDTPMLLRETDRSLPVAAAYTRGATSTTFVSPEISNDLSKIGSLTTTSPGAAGRIIYDGAINGAKGLIGEYFTINPSPYVGVALSAGEVRDVGEAMNVTLNGVMGQLSNAVKVVNNQMTLAEWESLHGNFMQQEKTKYDSMAASTLAGKIPGVGWILAPVVKALFDVTVTEQITNSFEIRVSLDTFIPGGPKNNIVVGGNLKNQIKLGDGGSFASGGDSADTIAVGKGNDNISGGAGTDTVVFSSSRAAYSISKQANGMNKVTGPDGADMLSHVERLRFSDGILAFDNLRTDTAGEGYLIYRAAFDRVPDAAGLGYWIRELERGQDYGAVVAASFIASPEFITKYGSNTSNTDFLNLIYQNVLDRAPDQAGSDYWLGQLNGGYARSNMLASFAISDENYNSVVPLISDGIFFV